MQNNEKSKKMQPLKLTTLETIYAAYEEDVDQLLTAFAQVYFISFLLFVHLFYHYLLID